MRSAAWGGEARCAMFGWAVCGGGEAWCEWWRGGGGE